MGLFSGNSSFFGGGFPSQICSTTVAFDKRKLERETIKNSDTLVGELVQTIDEAKEEFFELCTEGVVEMVVKGNSDYKTSFEIRDEAEKKIGDARRRYRDKRDHFNKYLENLNNQINELYKRKVEIAKTLNREAGDRPNMPRVTGTLYAPSYTYKPSTISRLCEYSGFVGMPDVKGRKESANEYLEDAKDFEVEVHGKIAEINKVQAYLDTIKMNLEEEEKLICALEESLKMKRSLKYNKIAEQLHILISEYILDSGGKKNDKYMEAIAMLKKLS